MSLDDIAQRQRHHWKTLAAEHPGTVQAVGSESIAHKYLRYAKLAEIFSQRGPAELSIHDVGCGVGDFYDWLKHSGHDLKQISYSASEITPEYCEIARQRHPEVQFYIRDILAKPVPDRYDYVILSGVFHQQGDVSHRRWVDYMQNLLSAAWGMTNVGMAFNVLTSYADFYKPGNFYADLSELQLFVVRHLSRFFRIDCSYPLFEATFHVYKPSSIKYLYPQNEFQRYFLDV